MKKMKLKRILKNIRFKSKKPEKKIPVPKNLPPERWSGDGSCLVVGRRFLSMD